MPEQSQTPASRRFLPLTSSSRKHQPTSIQKPPLNHPTQPISSSPFLHTHSSLQKVQLDEIETSFEEESQSVPTEGQYRTYTAHLKHHDIIEDDVYNSDLETDAGQLINPEVSGYQIHSEVSKQTSTNATHSPKANFSSPLAKRQKTSHFREPPNQVIEVSSSPSLECGSDPPDLEPRNTLQSYEFNKAGSLRPGILQNSNEDGVGEERIQTRSKSDGSMLVEPERPTSRIPFKGLSAGSAPWMDNPLPATFSPSKRRGKHEYSYGGTADTVRSWILDVAGEQSKTTEKDNQRKDVCTILRDSSGRFEVASDTQSQNWLLIRQDDQTDTVKVSKDDAHKGLRSIIVKGRATTWDLHGTQFVQGQISSNELHVAVLWNNDSTK